MDDLRRVPWASMRTESSVLEEFRRHEVNICAVGAWC